MIRRLLYKFTAGRPCRLISRDGTPYLERYYIGQLLGCTIYLHRFVSGDGDQEVHDHPFRAIALCLAGGYREERALLDPVQGWRRHYRLIFPGRINTIGLRTFHKICSTQRDTWTLFIHGPRRKGWGFLRNLGIDEHCSHGHVLVEYHQPFPLTTTEWWRDAPTGRDVGREERAA